MQSFDEQRDLRLEYLMKDGPGLYARMLALHQYIKDAGYDLDPEEEHALNADFSLLSFVLLALKNKNEIFPIETGIWEDSEIPTKLPQFIKNFDARHPFLLDAVNNAPDLMGEFRKKYVPAVEEKHPDKRLQIDQMVVLLKQGGYKNKLEVAQEKIDKSPNPRRLNEYRKFFRSIRLALRANKWDDINLDLVNKNFLDVQLKSLDDELINQNVIVAEAKKDFIKEHKGISKGYGLFSSVSYEWTLQEFLIHASKGMPAEKDGKMSDSYKVCKKLGWLNSKGEVLLLADIVEKYQAKANKPSAPTLTRGDRKED